MSRVGSNARQKEFVKLFNGMCGRYSRYEVWQDFVWMAAAAISNAVDKRYADQREQRYMDIIGKYSEKEAQVFPEMMSLIVLGMEEEPDQDFLGELYMELELGNSKAGQFFTPYCLCREMAELTMGKEVVQHSIEQHGYFSINDPACGAGAALVAAANVLRAWDINYQQTALFVAQDIDYTVGLMCYIQLSLLGCAGYVRIGNTITDPIRGNILLGGNNDANTWYTPMYLHPIWEMRRTIERAKLLFEAMPEKAAETVSQVMPEEAMCQSAAPEKTAGEAVATADSDTPAIIEVGKKHRRKQSAGQLMFDLLI